MPPISLFPFLFFPFLFLQLQFSVFFPPTKSCIFQQPGQSSATSFGICIDVQGMKTQLT